MCSGKRDQIGPLARALFDQELVELFLRMRGRADGVISCNGSCVPGGRKLFAARDGIFYPCEKVGNDFPIGRVDTGLDRDRIGRYIEDYRALCDEICRDCWAARVCRQCLVSVRRDGGISRERKLEACRGERQYWHNTLVRAATILVENPESLSFVKDVRVS